MAYPKYTRNPVGTAANIIEAGVPLDLAGWYGSSTNAADAYVQVFFKKAADVTVGTTVPDLVIIIPKTTGVAWASLQKTLHAEAGISFAVTTADNGSTAMTYGNTIDLTFFVE